MYVIGISNEAPQFDSMPVLKTTFYPDGGSFRPLCYARMAVQRNVGIVFDLEAFERDPVIAADPLEGSCAALALEVFRSGGVLLAAFGPKGNGVLYLCDEEFRHCEKLEGELSAETYSGVDEQGWYWGVRSVIPNKLLEEIYGFTEINNGHTIRGNVCKFQRAGKASHFGAASEKSLDSFPCVSY